MLHSDHLAQPVLLKLTASFIRPHFMEVKRVHVARRSNRARERVGQAAAAGAGLEDDFAWRKREVCDH